MSDAYTQIIKKESRPIVESIRDDIIARRDAEFFWPTGTQVYVGRQGSGKTISAVRHLIRLKEQYPRAIIVSNIKLNYYQELKFNEEIELLSLVESLKHKDEDGQYYSELAYIAFDTMDQLALALVSVNNEKYGVIYVVDEIHTYFNALDSKNIPMYVFTEISQQRKQRKLIVGTSQLFLRMAKPFREQCQSLIICDTKFGAFTIQKSYDGMTLEQQYDGSLIGDHKKTGWFWHSRKIRNAFDTYQKVVSGAEQYEQIQKIELVGKHNKKIKFG